MYLQNYSLVDSCLLIANDNEPGTIAIQDLCILQATVQTSQSVELLHHYMYIYMHGYGDLELRL